MHKSSWILQLETHWTLTLLQLLPRQPRQCCASTPKLEQLLLFFYGSLMSSSEGGADCSVVARKLSNYIKFRLQCVGCSAAAPHRWPAAVDVVSPSPSPSPTLSVLILGLLIDIYGNGWCSKSGAAAGCEGSSLRCQLGWLDWLPLPLIRVTNTLPPLSPVPHDTAVSQQIFGNLATKQCKSNPNPSCHSASRNEFSTWLRNIA